jgi:hypothetical protein
LTLQTVGCWLFKCLHRFSVDPHFFIQYNFVKTFQMTPMNSQLPYCLNLNEYFNLPAVFTSVFPIIPWEVLSKRLRQLTSTFWPGFISG